MPATSSRPTWKGQLRLSLVTIAVEMFTATRAGAKATFHQIHKPSGKRVRYAKVVEGIGEIDKSDIRKGYEYQRGDYVLLEDEELDAVKLETKKTLELVQFVDEGEIPPLYFDQPYFLAPADELAEDAFRVIRDAMRKAKKVGVGQLALRGNEYLVALRPCGKGMLLETLHYQEEVRKADPFFSDIAGKSTDDDLLEIATALIEKKTRKWDPSEYKNHYQAALRDLIQRKMKLKGRKLTVDDDDEPRGERGNVINLMEALKQSLEGGKSASRKPAAKSASKSGSRAKKAAKKPAAKTASKSRGKAA